MMPRVPRLTTGARAWKALALLTLVPLALAGCGSSPKPSGSAHASAQQSAGVPGECAAIVMKTLGRVVERVYHEGVKSERTGSAVYEITSSLALREAIEAGDRSAANIAAEDIVHSGHLTNLLVLVHGKRFADFGGLAVAPLRGTLLNASGHAIATYVASVWADEGFLAEVGGVISGHGALRQGSRSLGDSFPLGSSSLPEQGTLTRVGVTYRYTSFPAEAFPSGAIRVYLLRALSTTADLCRASSEGTIVNVLHHVANLIYAAERGGAAARQVARVEANGPLLEAVGQRDPAATETAIRALLNQHVVRLRVLDAAGNLLSDVGGPDVLAPVHGTLHSHGHTIGSFVLSIQDDEGYEKLAKRLEGLDVLVYYKGQIVKNSLGPVSFSEVPAHGSYSYHGRSFRVFTVRCTAFPSGPLVVRVLVPEPYLSQPIT
jgi:hypothetical protein